jgi:tetratricopeptide (TPR) repeat protein
MFAAHGSISMLVNYHAIRRQFARAGGEVLTVSHRHHSLVVSAFVSGAPPTGLRELRRAYDAAVERFGPDDFFTLKKIVEPHYDELSLEQLFAVVRMGGWDANILFGCLPAIARLAADADEAQRAELRDTLARVWSNYYPIGEERDLAFACGMALYYAAHYDDAIDYYERSRHLYGPAPRPSYWAAMAHYRSGRSERARELIEEALTLDPGFEAARAMRLKLRSAR